MSQTKVEAPFVENNATFRNMVTNGDMQISQRGTSFASLGNGDGGTFTLDRFGFFEEGDFGAAEATITQDTDVPTGQGFIKSLKVVCATADTSIATNTINYISQKFEGQMLQHLAKGTSGAKSTTLSFWCKSNLTGTFTLALRDQDNSRQFSTSYSLASANTWEKIIINIPADTTGALDNDNASSYRINWHLQAGTDKTGGALTTAWEAQAEGDRAVGQTNFYSSTSNNWYITGVQWEVGDAATDFEHLPHDVQEHRCMRYFQSYIDPPLRGAVNATQNMGRLGMVLPVTMRAAGTASLGAHGVYDGSNVTSIASTTVAYITDKQMEFDVALAAASVVVGRPGVVYISGGTTTTTLDAEL